MNKVHQLLFFLYLAVITSCAVSEEEKAADQQRHRDSVAAAQAMIRSAQLANESRANALKGINQEALKNDSIIRKDSILKVMKDTSAALKADTASAKKSVVVKPKTEVKPAIKKADPPKSQEKKKPATGNSNTIKKANQKK